MITVLGAGGFIGRRLAAALQGEGESVFAPARGDEAIFRRPLGRVIYCVGMTADYARQPAMTVEAHAGLFARVVERADYEHIVYLSSTRLYDFLDAPVAAPDATLPVDVRRPRLLYDLSKALGENLCLAASGGRGCVARLSGVFDWTPGAPGFLSEWLQRAAHERAFTLDSASGVVRDYIHVDDVVAALRAMSDARAGGVHNVATGENLSNADLAALFNAHGWTIGFARQSARSVLPVCDIASLAKLGVKPRAARAVIEDWMSKATTHATR